MSQKTRHLRQITLRGIDPEMEREIRRKAKEEGKSLNKVILELIGGSSGTGRRRKKPGGGSLLEFAGGWSERDVREFEKSVAIFEEVDDEMWK